MMTTRRVPAHMPAGATVSLSYRVRHPAARAMPPGMSQVQYVYHNLSEKRATGTQPEDQRRPTVCIINISFPFRLSHPARVQVSSNLKV
jgi:hypothetical protein